MSHIENLSVHCSLLIQPFLSSVYQYQILSLCACYIVVVYLDTKKLKICQQVQDAKDCFYT